MKNLVTVIAVLFLVTLTESCHKRDQRLYPYGWSLTDPKFDSLTRLAEAYMYTTLPPDSILAVAEQMDSLARLAGADSSELVARADYWKAYYHYMNWEPAEARATLTEADSLSSDLYTKTRIDGLRMTCGEFKAYDTFKKLLEQLEYYKSIGDDPQEGNTAMILSCNLLYTTVPELALYYLELADSLFGVSKAEDRKCNLRINAATLLCQTGRMDEAAETFELLFSDPTIVNNKDLYEILLRNHHYFFEDSASLFKGYAVQKEKEIDGIESKTLTMLYESLIGDYFLDEGRLDSAAHYFRYKLRDIDAILDDDMKSSIYPLYARYYDSIGDTRRAVAAMESYKAIVDTIKADQQPQNKVYAEYVNAKQQIDEENARESREMRERYYAVIAGLVMVLLVVTIMVQRLRHRHRIREMQSQLTAEQREREMLAMALTREASDKMLDYVKDEITRLSRESSVSGSDIARLETHLKLHLADREELQSFEKTFVSLHPDFEARLRAVAPDLSDNNIRLCSYIMMGLNNQEIASIMNIKASSLRQARLRLRQKFGLSKDDSLPEFLRQISGGG